VTEILKYQDVNFNYENFLRERGFSVIADWGKGTGVRWLEQAEANPPRGRHLPISQLSEFYARPDGTGNWQWMRAGEIDWTHGHVGYEPTPFMIGDIDSDGIPDGLYRDGRCLPALDPNLYLGLCNVGVVLKPPPATPQGGQQAGAPPQPGGLQAGAPPQPDPDRQR
jgi:hypothetical protein